MKFTVEVEEFWIEEDELSSSLARQIKDDIVSQMKKTVESKIDEQISLRVAKVIEEHINKTIQDKLSELIETGMIMKDGKAIAIKDYVSQLFISSNGWSNPRDKIISLADQFSKELKTRYDALFANRIVVKLNEQGMLKDEVVKLLING